MIYFTKPSGRVKQANPVFAPPRASNWLASLAVIGLFASPAYGQPVTDPTACPSGAAAVATQDADGSIAVGCGALTEPGLVILREAGEEETTQPTAPGIYEIDVLDEAGNVQTRREVPGEVIDGAFTLREDHEALDAFVEDGDAAAGDIIIPAPPTGSGQNIRLTLRLVRLVTGPSVIATGRATALVDHRQTAIGSNARTQGQLNVAIGAGAEAVGFNPGSDEVPAVPAQQIIRVDVPGVVGGRVFLDVKGSIGEETIDGERRLVFTLDGNQEAGTDGTQLTLIRGDIRRPDGGFYRAYAPIPEIPLVPADPATRSSIVSGTAVGTGARVQSDGGSAFGAGASVAGEGSVAIGRNARVGTAGVIGSPEVLGDYNVIRAPHSTGSATVTGIVTGSGPTAYIVLTEDHLVLGAAGTLVELSDTPVTVIDSTPMVPGTFTIAYDAVADTVTTNGLKGRLVGNTLTLTEAATVDGRSLAIGDVVNLGAGTIAITSYSPEVVQANTFRAANNAVAIGNNASVTGNNGIAIGANVSAEANQIRIGRDNQTDVRIGAYHLSAISTNTADIQTNRAGIASAVAIANLPSVQGPKGGWSLALGSFDGETAIAGGINFDVLSSSIVKIGIASSDGETSAGIGFGMGF